MPIGERFVRFFVGVGDFKSQNLLAASRKLAGWYTGKSTESRNIRRGMERVERAVVVINGADASECVPLLAAEALARGAIRVEIPLEKIKTSLEGEEPLRTRARELANKLDVSTALTDRRLVVTPQDVWDEAVKWRMIGHRPRRYYRGNGVGE